MSNSLISDLIGDFSKFHRKTDFFEMDVAVHRPAQSSSEPETLQKVPPHTLDLPKIGQEPNELRSFAQSSLEDRKIMLASRPVDF